MTHKPATPTPLVPMTKQQHAAYAALYAHALSLPGAWEDNPWGHVAIKVKKKIFAFLSNGSMAESGCAVGLGVKLPISAGQALSLPFATPTGYGLGKAGWCDIKFGAGDDVPVDILTPWITESWRAIAPATLVKQRDAGATTKTTKAPAKKTASAQASTTKKPLAKKPLAKKKTAKKKTAKKA